MALEALECGENVIEAEKTPSVGDASANSISTPICAACWRKSTFRF